MTVPSITHDLNIKQAALPATYEKARTALAECFKIDECWTWADKAAALASYAKQADDDELYKMARRIQGRAVQRVGELLKEFEAAGKRTDKPGVGSDTRSQKEVAQEAGLSKRQQVTAVRVANVPKEKFEQEVESPNPPSVSKLAEMGKKVRPERQPQPWDQLVERDPKAFSNATQAYGILREFVDECCNCYDPIKIADFAMPQEATEARRNVTIVKAWLDKLVANLKG